MLSLPRLVGRSIARKPIAAGMLETCCSCCHNSFSRCQCWILACATRFYAAVDNNNNKRFRHAELNEDTIPQLNKVDSILDFAETKPKTLDQDKLFPSHRPTEMVLNAVNDFVDTPLSTAEQMRLFKKALVVKRVVNMNGKGKQPSMYALVVVGNGKGLAGYGEGKDEEAARAVFKATNKAIKNLRYFDRYDDRTIPMDIEHKFHATRLELRSRPPGKREREGG